MAERQSPPPLPPALEDATSRPVASGGHPYLMQGKLYLHWGSGHDGTTSTERDLQIANFKTYSQSSANKPLLSSLAARQLRSIRLLGPSADQPIEATQPIAIGMGLDSYTDNGLLLDPIFGVPYLPGQSLKGVTRNFLLVAYAREAGIERLSHEAALQRNWERKQTGAEMPSQLERFERLLCSSIPKQAIGDLPQSHEAKVGEWLEKKRGVAKVERFRALFGSGPDPWDNNAARGAVRFYDALPVWDGENGPRLIQRALTPHHKEYFNEFNSRFSETTSQQEFATAQIPAAVDETPVPAGYLAVDVGARFHLMIGASEQLLADWTMKVTLAALAQMGIGGKIGSGNGRFRTLA